MESAAHPGRARRWMILLACLLAAAQLAELVLPRSDPRAGSPATLVFVAALCLLLACYPTGRPVPRWTLGVAAAITALFAASLTAGPELSSRFLWPLPVAPLLLLLVGGQGYRYWRRASAAERESVRWPLLGVLLLLTLFVPADLIALAVTGDTITNPPAAVVAAQQLAFLLPAAGFLAGLIARPTELVDRLLAIWVAIVAAGTTLGALFAGILVVVGLWTDQPWPALVAAAGTLVAGIWIVPLAARLGRRVVFRGRQEEHRAVAALTRRLHATMEPEEIPAVVVEAVRRAVGARAVRLRRSGQLSAWALAGAAESTGPDAGEPVETEVRHLGLPVAILTVWPRDAESALASADRRLIQTLAAAAAPALHSARLASAFPELTERERQVLAGITRGLPNAAIAARLGVSSKTVANYVSIVLTKLRVPDRERAAELARRRAAPHGGA